MSYIKMDDKLNLECSHPLVEKVFFHGSASRNCDKVSMGLTVCLKDGVTEFVETFFDENLNEVNLVKKANDFLDKDGWLNNDKGISIWGGEK